MTRLRVAERCSVCDEHIPSSRRVDADTCSQKCQTKRLNLRKSIVLKLGHRFIERLTPAQLRRQLTTDEFELLQREISQRAKSPAPKPQFAGGRPRISAHAWQQLVKIAKQAGVSPGAYLEQLFNERHKQ